MYNAVTRRSAVRFQHWYRNSIGVIATLLMVSILSALPTQANPPTTMAQPNAYSYYAKAADMLDATVKDKLRQRDTLSPDERKALLTKLSPALVTVREGFAYPCHLPKVSSLDDKMPWLASSRYLARLFSMEMDEHASAGKYGPATSSGIDIMRFGSDYSNESPMISHLVAIALQFIGRKSLWEYVDHLSAQESASAITRLDELNSRATPYVNVIREEQRMAMLVLQHFRDDPQSCKDMIKQESGTSIDWNANKDRGLQRYLQLAMAEYPKRMDSTIAMTKTPFSQWKPLPASDNPFVNIFQIDFVKAGFKTLYNDTQNRLLLLTYALHAYHIEHNQYPHTLAELCPKYLAKLPLDPFSSGVSFMYKQTDTGYCLYSIGPDGKDNDGNTIVDNNNSKTSHRVTQESIGDIVAGINID